MFESIDATAPLFVVVDCTGPLDAIAQARGYCRGFANLNPGSAPVIRRTAAVAEFGDIVTAE